MARAQGDILGLVRAANGDHYASEGGTRVVRIAPDGTRRALVDGRDGVHGLSFQEHRLIACESYAGNVLAVDVDTGEVTTRAHGLGNPSYAVPAADGLVLTTLGAVVAVVRQCADRRSSDVGDITA